MSQDTLLRTLQARRLPRSRTPGSPAWSEHRPARLIAGRYLLVEELGFGSTATVWLAHDAVLGRPVALKHFRGPGDPRHGSTSRAALHEAHMAARFSHRGIVQVHDLALHERDPWLVMELVDGPSLATEIRCRGRLPYGRVLDVAHEVLRTLEVVHAAGVVHRDVKPGNLITASPGRVVLGDFGLAAEAGAATAHSTAPLVGSAPYIAPETSVDGGFAPATDLFALGVTLFHALEGHLPFQGATASGTVWALRVQPIPPMPHAGALRPLIEGLLHKDPRRRLDGPEALACWAEAAEEHSAGEMDADDLDGHVAGRA